MIQLFCSPPLLNRQRTWWRLGLPFYALLLALFLDLLQLLRGRDLCLVDFLSALSERLNFAILQDLAFSILFADARVVALGQFVENAIVSRVSLLVVLIVVTMLVSVTMLWEKGIERLVNATLILAMVLAMIMVMVSIVCVSTTWCTMLMWFAVIVAWWLLCQVFDHIAHLAEELVPLPVVWVDLSVEISSVLGRFLGSWVEGNLWLGGVDEGEVRDGEEKRNSRCGCVICAKSHCFSDLKKARLILIKMIN